MTEAGRLLCALRAAGCDVFVEDDEFWCSPPARAVNWDGDVEAAIEEHRWELRALMLDERLRVH